MSTAHSSTVRAEATPVTLKERTEKGGGGERPRNTLALEEDSVKGPGCCHPLLGSTEGHREVPGCSAPRQGLLKTEPGPLYFKNDFLN